MIWLKLTDPEGKIIRMNASHLVAYYRDEGGSTHLIVPIDASRWYTEVRESPEEIDRLISEAMAAQDS